MAKLQTSFDLKGPVGTTAGFVLWSPEYHPSINRNYTDNGDPIDDYLVAHRNVFIGYTAESGTPFTNSADLPFGGEHLNFDPSQTPGATGKVVTVNDPAAVFVGSDLVASARTIGAVVKLTYTGSTLNLGGQVASITGFPASALLAGTGTGVFSVNQLFQWSNDHLRTPTETVEVVHQPHATSDVFRDGRATGYQYGYKAAGAPSPSPTYLSALGESQQPTLMGFAWRGLPTETTSPMSFDLLKTVEWRPEPVSGLVGSTRSGTAALVPPIHIARHELAQKKPSWATKAFRSAEKDIAKWGPKLLGLAIGAAGAEASGGASLLGPLASFAYGNRNHLLTDMR